MLMGQAKKDPSKAAEAEEIKKQVTAQADRLKELGKPRKPSCRTRSATSCTPSRR